MRNVPERRPAIAASSCSAAAWVDGVFDAAAPFNTGGAYVKGLEDEGSERVRAAYGSETFARLAAMKQRWDPENVFRLNQNIPPSRARTTDMA